MDRQVHANEKDIKGLVDAVLSLHNSNSHMPHIGIYLDGKQTRRLGQLGWIKQVQVEGRYQMAWEVTDAGYEAIKPQMIVASFALFMKNIALKHSRDEREKIGKGLQGALEKLGCVVREVYVFEWGNWYENMQVNFKQFNISYHSKIKKYAVGIYSLGNSNETMDVAAFRKELELAELACDYMNNVLEGQIAYYAAQ